jgi:lipopolysaccharide transport protein LptA
MTGFKSRQQEVNMFSKLILSMTISLITFVATKPMYLAAEQSANSSKNLINADFQKAPTFISANHMTLLIGERKVTYTGNVEVIHEDIKITCDRLEAFYSEDNQIDIINAFDNVHIVRESGAEAKSEKAVYRKADETITLSISPEIQEKGSIITADIIRIFLQEDRSEAEGEVRVKLVQADSGGIGTGGLRDKNKKRASGPRKGNKTPIKE